MKREKENSPVCQSVRSSFADLVRLTAEQIDLQEFALGRPALAERSKG